MKEYKAFLELEITEDADCDEIESINGFLLRHFPSEDFGMYDSSCHGTSFGWTLGITDSVPDELVILSETYPKLTFSLRILDIRGLSVEHFRAGNPV